ncbi:hypothetical protein QJS10_CPB17g00905 [Acorus calamus]|uniref:Uncharacterized protein n=1 Tax=Acorus calamus TaxID=4465 RepID=A0AAV9CSI2_ACOCL|nr:hypothetical protein QJS10_CPB17g00905 [Acorus calamus]
MWSYAGADWSSLNNMIGFFFTYWMSSDDGKCCIWDARQSQSAPRIYIPKPLDVIPGKSDPFKNAGPVVHQILCCAYNANGTVFVTGSSDTFARVWNACKSNVEESEQPYHEMDLLSGHENDVNYVQFRFSHDNIITCSRDGSAIIWVPRFRKSHFVSIFSKHGNSSSGGAIPPNSRIQKLIPWGYGSGELSIKSQCIRPIQVDEVDQIFIIGTGQGESQKDAKYDQFFFGDYRPLIQDTRGNVLDQNVQLLPFLDLGRVVQPLSEFIDAIEWEPENEVQSNDTDSEYNVTDEFSSECEHESLCNSSSGDPECSAEGGFAGPPEFSEPQLNPGVRKLVLKLPACPSKKAIPPEILKSGYHEQADVVDVPTKACAENVDLTCLNTPEASICFINMVGPSIAQNGCETRSRGGHAEKYVEHPDLSAGYKGSRIKWGRSESPLIKTPEIGRCTSNGCLCEFRQTWDVEIKANGHSKSEDDYERISSHFEKQSQEENPDHDLYENEMQYMDAAEEDPYDFLVERTRYDAAMERNWTHRDKCQMWWRDDGGDGGSWYDGQALGDYSRTINDFSVFPSNPKGERAGGYWYHEDTQAFFDDVNHFKMIRAMCKPSCSICDRIEGEQQQQHQGCDGGGGVRKRQKFNNVEQLKGHLFHQHKLIMCNLCLEGRKIHFRREHLLCDDEACLAKKFIVFQSEANMKMDKKLIHNHDFYIALISNLSGHMVKALDLMLYMSPPSLLSMIWSLLRHLQDMLKQSAKKLKITQDDAASSSSFGSCYHGGIARENGLASSSSVIPSWNMVAKGKLNHSMSAPNLSDGGGSLSSSSTSTMVPGALRTDKQMLPGSNGQPLLGVEDVETANKTLVERMLQALGKDKDKFSAFKLISGEYHRGEINTLEYLAYVEQFGLSHLTIELAWLCPDCQKQEELIDAYQANNSLLENGIGKAASSKSSKHLLKGKRSHVKETMEDSVIKTVRELQALNIEPQEGEVEVLSKEGYRSAMGKGKLLQEVDLRSSNNQLANPSGQNGSVLTTVSNGQNKQQKRKTSKFHRARLGDGSMSSLLDHDRSNANQEEETNSNNVPECAPTRGVWRSGAGKKLFLK